jgi:hypothetical protein
VQGGLGGVRTAADAAAVRRPCCLLPTRPCPPAPLPSPQGQEPQNIDKEFLRLWFRANCDPYNDPVGGTSSNSSSTALPSSART